MSEQKIKRLGKYRVRKATGALTLVIPAEFVEDNQVEAGQVYTLFDVDGALVARRVEE